MCQLKTEIGRVDHKIRPNCCLQETYFKYKDTHRLKVKHWRKIYLTDTNGRVVRVAIMISDRTDLKAGKVIRDKEGHHNKGISFPKRHNNSSHVCA